MPQHEIGTQEGWQAARDELLAEEKELTRRSDELARKRRGETEYAIGAIPLGGYISMSGMFPPLRPGGGSRSASTGFFDTLVQDARDTSAESIQEGTVHHLTGTRAVTVTKNVWASAYWVWNAHYWEGATFVQFAQFDMASVIVMDSVAWPGAMWSRVMPSRWLAESSFHMARAEASAISCGVMSETGFIGR